MGVYKEARKLREAQEHLELVARRCALWKLVWREVHKDEKLKPHPRPMPVLSNDQIRDDLRKLVR